MNVVLSKILIDKVRQDFSNKNFATAVINAGNILS